MEILPLAGLPEVRAGDDLAELIASALHAAGTRLRGGDVLAVAQKVVSKAEGRTRRKSEVSPSPRALALAAVHGKDPRHVQVVLDETQELVRADAGRLICRTRHGFVCANAGVDASNAGAPDALVLLPADPDASARRLRAALGERLGLAPAVVVTDSFGRPWRVGQVEVAIGCAGLQVVEDWRGRTDSDGRPLHATQIALPDELAAAADLVRAKDSHEPVILLRGMTRGIIRDDGPGVAALVRARSEDLFA